MIEYPPLTGLLTRYASGFADVPPRFTRLFGLASPASGFAGTFDFWGSKNIVGFLVTLFNHMSANAFPWADASQL